MAIGAQAGVSPGGRKGRGGNGWSDHDDAQTVGYAIDIFGSVSQLDAAASAMAAATGKFWSFEAKENTEDWFDISVNGYGLQIGWRQPGHSPNDSTPHVHLGCRQGR